ncbi:hypothetical protein BGW41_006494 [Actinomortierella wolfii]|nr:hypothetical protein BGW41_006494 [Actinomortierella wolfii]
MRGRLPDTILQNSIDLSSLSADAREEYEHIQRVSRRYISTIESDFKKSPEIKSTGVLDRLTATQLGELMRIVGEDMKEIVVRLAMAMYQVGDAMNQLSQDIRAENYLAIALRLLQKAFVCLREDAGIEQNSPVTQYWRYECLAARINLSLVRLIT